MPEQAFRFGRARHLVGIAGWPPSTVRDSVGVIVLNAGLVHRIGPFRLHVEMTRRLNARGYPTLRFDLSTIGDSAASGESQTRKQQICADVADAMKLLGEQAACQRFVLIGLCSGSQSAHMVACSDARVAGAVFLDGYAYRTLGYHLRYYVPRLLDAKRWRDAFSRRRQAQQGSSEPAFTVAPLPQAVVRTDLAGMLERGLKLCLIYSGGISRYFNHARQFRECFGGLVRHPDVFTLFFKEADHTYILTGDRKRLLEQIERWLAQNFPVTAGTSS
ncbi:MAG TPA: alpha/beta fold hydrolase [Dyella sp.]|uniref:alpha/beta fold hydrolase n=1 Tax=Dyella sp. TaxID=1869338 RepID=UPI002B7017D7|nr:alpha/beta fold hydrolase [Dyella sp.]HUB91332.1 alpha/beta fold hydrolase [Dyella sp.]